jgi:hypothetical protein
LPPGWVIVVGDPAARGALEGVECSWRRPSTPG